MEVNNRRVGNYILKNMCMCVYIYMVKSNEYEFYKEK